MSDKGTAIPIPDDWDQLDDAAKDATVAAMLKRVGTDTGVRGKRSRRFRRARS